MKKLHVPVVITVVSILLLFAPTVSPRYGGLCSTAFAEEPWKLELMDVCSKTDEAMSFTKDELKILLQRGKKLKPVIDSLEETPRKVFQKRLQSCIALYSFVLGAKEAEKK